jgi:hypothetical protein
MRPTTISGGAARAAAVLLVHDPEPDDHAVQSGYRFSDQIMRKD